MVLILLTNLMVKRSRYRPDHVSVQTSEPNQNCGTKTGTSLDRRFPGYKPNRNRALARPVPVSFFKNRNRRFRFRNPVFIYSFWPFVPACCCSIATGLGPGLGARPSNGLRPGLAGQLASNSPILDRWSPAAKTWPPSSNNPKLDHWPQTVPFLNRWSFVFLIFLKFKN